MNLLVREPHLVEQLQEPGIAAYRVPDAGRPQKSDGGFALLAGEFEFPKHLVGIPQPGVQQRKAARRNTVVPRSLLQLPQYRARPRNVSAASFQIAKRGERLGGWRRLLHLF